MEILSKISKPINKFKYEQIKNNKNYIKELELLNNERNLKYYNHIINNLNINKNNPNNSYIMWIFDKVDIIDINEASKIRTGRYSLPDIDCDFPISKREQIIEYIKNKYGHKYVSQMATFSRMQGRSAIKDVLSVHNACSFEEMNRITESIPDESKIADELQEMIEEDGHASIIQWALENIPEKLKEWVYLDDNGVLQSSQGNYANLFAQAIRLEGTKRSQGKHAAGIIISANPLEDVCPMIYDKHSKSMIAGLEMNALESMGHTKFDILGIACLDKLMRFKELLATGEYSDG